MISHAIKIGRSHRLMQQNCHDLAITSTLAPGCAFGLVLDGCSSKYRPDYLAYQASGSTEERKYNDGAIAIWWNQST